MCLLFFHCAKSANIIDYIWTEIAIKNAILEKKKKKKNTVKRKALSDTSFSSRQVLNILQVIGTICQRPTFHHVKKIKLN